MCGIIGYVGKRNAVDVLISGLSRLEYRGYDSAGIAIAEGRELSVRKKQGKLHVLMEEISKNPVSGTSGIGHTRWATHGEPSDINSHPHFDYLENIAIVHNGIIENYLELREELEGKGHKFSSETDSEVIAQLMGHYYKGDLYEALRKTVKRLEGSYAIVALHKKEPGRMVGTRKDSPLIAGIGNGEFFLASDIPAVLEYTRDVIYLENGETIDITKKGVSLYGLDGKEKRTRPMHVEWNIAQAEKSGYPHFMLKEIFEQPELLRKIFSKRIKDEKVVFDELVFQKKDFGKIKNIAIVACGTAYHAGMVARYFMEGLVKLPVAVDCASEFRYRDPMVGEDTLFIVISQSGETADSMAAMREAKKRGALTLAVCNVLGSSIARESDGVIYTYAGPEIAVASTKAYTAQIATLHLFAHYLASELGRKNLNEKAAFREFRKISVLARNFLEGCRSERNRIAGYAAEFRRYYLEKNNKSSFLYLARHINYPNALEGALKLKEISYISAEGYPAGEMKHGPIALIDENPWVVCIAVESRTREKMISNIREVKARGGIVLAVLTEGDELAEDKGINYYIEVPRLPEMFSPILVAIPLQLLAYYVAREFGYDIDKPRNLAKSVTVE